MRLLLKISGSEHPIPFNYQANLLGVFHKWVRAPEIHDTLSLYSYSWLRNGKLGPEGFYFRDGAEWMINFHDADYARSLVQGILDSPEMFHGLSVREVILVPNPTFPDNYRFYLSSPALVKREREPRKFDHLTYENPAANEILTSVIKTKLRAAGFDDLSLSLRFDSSHAGAKTKLVTLHDIQNKASFCPVIAEGDPDAISFCWDVGVGHSTGAGFGGVV